MYFVGLGRLIICIDPVLSNITSTKSDHYVYCKDNSNSRFGNISKYPTSSFLGSVERGRDLSLFLMTRDIRDLVTWDGVVKSPIPRTRKHQTHAQTRKSPLLRRLLHHLHSHPVRQPWPTGFERPRWCEWLRLSSVSNHTWWVAPSFWSKRHPRHICSLRFH